MFLLLASVVRVMLVLAKIGFFLNQEGKDINFNENEY